MVLKVVLSFALIFTALVQAPSLYSITQKRADKFLGKYWVDIDYKLSSEKVNDSDAAEIYAVYHEDQNPAAYVLFAEEMGKVDTFIYLIIFSPDGSIKKVSVLLYKENYGGEIASKRFLKQFEGKSNGMDMEYNRDIDGISGATLSVQAISRGVRKNSITFTKFINQLK